MTDMLNIALPKGRLGEKVYNLLKKAGYACPAIEDPGRKLIFENPETHVRYFWVKPSDVAIYVERGAADIGIAVFYGSGHIPRNDLGHIVIKTEKRSSFGIKLAAEADVFHNSKSVSNRSNIIAVLTDIFRCRVAHKCPAVDIFHS